MVIDHTSHLHNTTSIYNSLTIEEGPEGFSLTRKFSRVTDPQKDERMQHIHCYIIWICPFYVLDTFLHDSEKDIKYQSRSWQRNFVGLSRKHAIIAGILLKIESGTMNTQLHIFYANIL